MTMLLMVWIPTCGRVCINNPNHHHLSFTDIVWEQKANKLPHLISTSHSLRAQLIKLILGMGKLVRPHL